MNSRCKSFSIHLQRLEYISNTPSHSTPNHTPFHTSPHRHSLLAKSLSTSHILLSHYLSLPLKTILLVPITTQLSLLYTTMILGSLALSLSNPNPNPNFISNPNPNYTFFLDALGAKFEGKSTWVSRMKAFFAKSRRWFEQKVGEGVIVGGDREGGNGDGGMDRGFVEVLPTVLRWCVDFWGVECGSGGGSDGRG